MAQSLQIDAENIRQTQSRCLKAFLGADLRGGSVLTAELGCSVVQPVKEVVNRFGNSELW